MSRWVPFPLIALALLVVWLLLQQSLSPGAVLVGAIAALAASATLVALELPRARFRRPQAAIALAGVVLVEIIRSNRAVAQIILFPGTRKRSSGFVRIPLDMRDRYGLLVLACIITATPGTIWVEYDSAGSTVLLHVLDLVDREEWVRTVKGRYERRLMEIFE
jgi:multicomponent K+:H+ antiporter subunit E